MASFIRYSFFLLCSSRNETVHTDVWRSQFPLENEFAEDIQFMNSYLDLNYLCIKTFLHIRFRKIILYSHIDFATILSSSGCLSITTLYFGENRRSFSAKLQNTRTLISISWNNKSCHWMYKCWMYTRKSYLNLLLFYWFVSRSTKVACAGSEVRSSNWTFTAVALNTLWLNYRI